MNYSRQREIILKVLKSTTSHPTAEWIYENCKAEMPSISLGTVYRNLAQLEACGEIIKVQGVFEKDRYDATTTPHAHFICEKCGTVTDFDIPDKLRAKIVALTDARHTAKSFDLTYRGVCADCADKAGSKNSN